MVVLCIKNQEYGERHDTLDDKAETRNKSTDLTHNLVYIKAQFPFLGLK